MAFWKGSHPDWYGVLKELRKVIHAKERMMPFRPTLEDIQGLVDDARAIYLSNSKKYLSPLGVSSLTTVLHQLTFFFYFFLDQSLSRKFNEAVLFVATDGQHKAHTADLKTGKRSMSQQPNTHNQTYGFVMGKKLNAAQIMRNKLLSSMFTDTNIVSSMHLYINVSSIIFVFMPFANFS
jgi:hypothetical protein